MVAETVQTSGTQTHYNSPLQNFSASIIQITDPSDLIKYIEFNLRQARINVVTGEQEYDVDNMLLNENGIRGCISFIQGIINQNTVMSNLSENDIKLLMRTTIYTTTQQLMGNRIRWGIKVSEDRTRITQIIYPAVYICLRRSFEEGERGFWKGAIGEHIVNDGTSGTRQQQTGFLQRLNPFK